MSSGVALWWLALAALLVPIWLHRQQRQRRQAAPLATARFLPAAEPKQLRIWRWTEQVLLLLRCLLLTALVAWLADVAFAWRGDTVLLGPGLDPAWRDAQIVAAGFQGARRIDAGSRPLAWFQAHEAEWRADARLLIVANGADLPMPAQLPRLAHTVELRARPAKADSREHHIVLASERPALWQALFATFERAGDGVQRYRFDSAPKADTELVIWDMPSMPPPQWRVPLWWVAEPGQFKEFAQAPLVDGMRIADSERGRLWSAAAWPPRDVDSARQLYQAWQQLHYGPAAYGLPTRLTPNASGAAGVPEGALRTLLGYLLAALFALERIATHARKR